MLRCIIVQDFALRLGGNLNKRNNSSAVSLGKECSERKVVIIDLKVVVKNSDLVEGDSAGFVTHHHVLATA